MTNRVAGLEALVVAKRVAATHDEDELYRRERKDILAAARAAAYEEEVKGSPYSTVRGAAIDAALEYLNGRISNLAHENPFGLVA